MITDKKVSWYYRDLNRKELKANGFISTNTIVSKEYQLKFGRIDCDKLRILAQTNKLQAIRVNTQGSITYWYKKEDIDNVANECLFSF